jgi:hypothetical protein
MEVLTLRVRIAMLWLFQAVTMSATSLLSLMRPGMIEQVMTGEVEGLQMTTGMLLFMALFWLIPLIMAFLCVTLRDSANRWTNVVLGLVFAVWSTFHLALHIMGGQLPLEQLLLHAALIVAPALIVWYAWRWPKAVA